MKFSISSSILLLAGSTYGAIVSSGNLAQKEYYKGLSRSFGPEVPFKEYSTPNYAQRQKDYSSFTLTQHPEDIAVAFAESELTKSDYKVTSAYKTDLNGVTHVYLRQVVNGLEVVNGDININVDRFGQVISYGNSFARGIEKMHDSPTTILKVKK
jgi:extracellular elastinolytic metalloproteinase